MVRGISKRVIVVKSPDPKIFEEAIFIVREDYAGASGLSEKDILNEARSAANRYLHAAARKRQGILSRLRGPLYAAAGAAATAAAWLAVHFISV